MHKVLIGIVLLAALAYASPAHADFMVTTSILEFTAGGPAQQDIELVSRSQDVQYIETQISEIVHPGQADESRLVIDDPAKSGLLVTPDKTILAGGGRKVLRFVLLKQPDAQEHIYRVAVKPVIKGLDNSGKIGLKILVGYEILVIVRPAAMAPSYTASRNGKTFSVTNNGNTNILFQSGKQCPTQATCKIAPVLRAYPGTSDHVELPFDAPVTYSLWDGQATSETQFP